MTDVAMLIEQLATATCKLYHVCNDKAILLDEKKRHILTIEDQDKRYERLVDWANRMEANVADDLRLCQQRASLRGEINKSLGISAGAEVKMYG